MQGLSLLFAVIEAYRKSLLHKLSSWLLDL